MSADLAKPAPLWDLPVRLFHWLLVALIAFSWWSGEEHYMDWHRTSGYAILGLIVFRVLWGFLGTRTARFAGFVRGPAAVAAYMGKLGSRDAEASQGHNPLGGWSVVAMLLAIAAMVTAGLFAVDVDGFESGPLADYISFDAGRSAAEVHEVIFNVILALIALHVLAIVFYTVWKKQRLVPAMVHGKGAKGVDAAANTPVSLPKLAISVVVAAALAYAVSTGFRF